MNVYQLLVEYGAWLARRMAIEARMDAGQDVGDDLFKSDDAGIELLESFVRAATG